MQVSLNTSFIAAVDLNIVFNVAVVLYENGTLNRDINLPVSQFNVCNLGVSCPVKAGTTVTEKAMLPIPSTHPSVSYVSM